MGALRGFAAVAVTFVLFAGTGCTAGPASVESEARRSSLGGESPLVDIFDDVARESGVPAEVLATLSYAETRLRFADTHLHEDHSGMPAAIGLMALSDEGARDLHYAARLASLDPELVRTDARANVRAAAELLVDYAGPSRSTRDVADWAPALAKYGGDEVAAEVMRHLRRGWRGNDADGYAVVCSARPEALRAGDGIGSETFELGYPGSIWNPAHSSNYTNSSRTAATIDSVVIHTTQGSYAGAISWFKNSSSNVSSQYVIRSSDGQITQMVDDTDTAWHASCYNSRSIGIEHEGFVADPDLWYTEAMYTESAKLTAWAAEQWGIPLDRAHIVAHAEVGCTTHTDPGSGWDWDHYMELVLSGGDAIFEASYADQDTPDQMVAGEERIVWFDFVNDSNVTWSLNDTRLGTMNPMDRESPFYVEGSWMGPNRATGADHSNYAPGDVGRFTFLIRAPEVEETTTFQEDFQLVQEGEAWFGPVVSMNITVTPANGDPDRDPDPDPDSDPDPDPDPDGAPSKVRGGCSAGGGASSWWCAIIVGGALLSRRRRYHR